jgi:hypothetical protein
MQHLGYISIAERLSERFHMDIDLLKVLNPNARFAVGETVSLAMPGKPRSGRVKRIEARKNAGQVLAFAEDGSLLAVYPATPPPFFQFEFEHPCQFQMRSTAPSKV